MEKGGYRVRGDRPLRYTYEGCLSPGQGEGGHLWDTGESFPGGWDSKDDGPEAGERESYLSNSRDTGEVDWGGCVGHEVPAVWALVVR